METYKGIKEDRSKQKTEDVKRVFRKKFLLLEKGESSVAKNENREPTSEGKIGGRTGRAF